MPELWNVEWPNINTQRKYPLAEGTTPVDGSFILPDDLIADLVFSVNVGLTPALDPSLFHIAQVGVFSGGVTISFAYNETIFATVSVPLATFSEYSVYQIVGTGEFFDTQGWVTIGQIDSIVKYPGAWTFTVDTGRLNPAVIRPNLRAVTSLSVETPDGQSAPFTGDIVLSAGSNIRFRVVPTATGAEIIVDAIDSDGFTEGCDCEDIAVDLPCIQTINGVRPNAGNIALLGTTCLDVANGAGEITIADSCSEPCCDCNELQVVTDTLEQVMAQVNSVDVTAGRLGEVLSNLSDNIGVPRDS